MNRHELRQPSFRVRNPGTELAKPRRPHGSSEQLKRAQRRTSSSSAHIGHGHKSQEPSPSSAPPLSMPSSARRARATAPCDKGTRREGLLPVARSLAKSVASATSPTPSGSHSPPPLLCSSSASPPPPLLLRLLRSSAPPRDGKRSSPPSMRARPVMRALHYMPLMRACRRWWPSCGPGTERWPRSRSSWVGAW